MIVLIINQVRTSRDLIELRIHWGQLPHRHLARRLADRFLMSPTTLKSFVAGIGDPGSPMSARHGAVRWRGRFAVPGLVP